VFEPLRHSPEQDVVFLGDDKPVRLKPLPASHRKRTSSNKSRNNSVQEGDDREQTEQQAQQQQQHLKRGQKGKLKQMKEKYKYQDEEERKLRMEILQVLLLYSLCLYYPAISVSFSPIASSCVSFWLNIFHFDCACIILCTYPV
jgi:Flp pilus assembly protein TadB